MSSQNIWAPRGSMIQSNMGMINTPGAVRPSADNDMRALGLLTLGGKLYDSADQAGYIAKGANAVGDVTSDTLDFFTPGFLGGDNFFDTDAFRDYPGIKGGIDSQLEMDTAKDLLVKSKDPERIKDLKSLIEDGEIKRAEWERRQRR